MGYKSVLYLDITQEDRDASRRFGPLYHARSADQDFEAAVDRMQAPVGLAKRVKMEILLEIEDED